MQEVLFRDLGQMPYKEAWDYQEELLQKNIATKAQLRNLAETLPSQSPDQKNAGSLLTLEDSLSTQHHLLFVEHPPVYTLGKSGNAGNVLLSEENLKARGIEYFHTNRGGDITFHGPQQIVGYPILDLEKFYTDIGKYLRNMEEMIILTLAAHR